MKYHSLAACHGKLLQGAKPGGRNCSRPCSDLSMVLTDWPCLDQGKAKGISHPTPLPGPSPQNALKFGLLGEQRLGAERPETFL